MCFSICLCTVFIDFSLLKVIRLCTFTCIYWYAYGCNSYIYIYIYTWLSFYCMLVTFRITRVCEVLISDAPVDVLARDMMMFFSLQGDTTTNI